MSPVPRRRKRAFPHAVALLHSFAYEEALEEFTAIARQDPKCAMAYWGEAMTWWRPLWYLPDDNALRNGFAAIEKAASLDLQTGRESGYVAALLAFYTDYDKINHRTRAMNYRMVMERLHRYLPQGQRGGGILRAVAAGHRLAGGQDLPGPAPGRGHPGKDLCRAARPSRGGALHHPQLRQPGTGQGRAAGGAQLRAHRPVGAARPAHAVAHLYPAGAVAGFHHLQCGGGKSGEAI